MMFIAEDLHLFHSTFPLVENVKIQKGVLVRIVQFVKELIISAQLPLHFKVFAPPLSPPFSYINQYSIQELTLYTKLSNL
jgi:hypothetical protein